MDTYLLDMGVLMIIVCKPVIIKKSQYDHMIMPSTPNIIIDQSKMRQKSMFCAKIYPWQFFHNLSTNIVGNSSRYIFDNILLSQPKFLSD